MSNDIIVEVSDPQPIIIEVSDPQPIIIEVESIASGSGLPAGTTTGDIVRYNSVSGVWEVKSEPFEFKGLVLTPALASLVDVEGAIYYKSDAKAVMVCTDI